MLHTITQSVNLFILLKKTVMFCTLQWTQGLNTDFKFVKKKKKDLNGLLKVTQTIIMTLQVYEKERKKETEISTPSCLYTVYLYSLK